MHTIIDGISSQGRRANYATSMSEIEYGHPGMKTRPKSKTELLHPEKYADRSMESPRVPPCHNASSESFIQCIIVHWWKLGPPGWKILPRWVECRAKKTGNAYWQCTRSQLKDDSKLFQTEPTEEVSASALFLWDLSIGFQSVEESESALIGREIPDEIGFLEAVIELLKAILDAELQRVFRNWIGHGERVIGAWGNYLTL
jgi:hypothetical protein